MKPSAYKSTLEKQRLTPRRSLPVHHTPPTHPNPLDPPSSLSQSQLKRNKKSAQTPQYLSLYSASAKVQQHLAPLHTMKQKSHHTHPNHMDESTPQLPQSSSPPPERKIYDQKQPSHTDIIDYSAENPRTSLRQTKAQTAFTEESLFHPMNNKPAWYVRNRLTTSTQLHNTQPISTTGRVELDNSPLSLLASTSSDQTVGTTPSEGSSDTSSVNLCQYKHQSYSLPRTGTKEVSSAPSLKCSLSSIKSDSTEIGTTLPHLPVVQNPTLATKEHSSIAIHIGSDKPRPHIPTTADHSTTGQPKHADPVYNHKYSCNRPCIVKPLDDKRVGPSKSDHRPSETKNIPPSSPESSANGQNPQDRHLGDDCKHKDSGSLRFVFNNCNGISLHKDSLKFLVASSRALQADWIGIAETHLDTQKAPVCTQIHSSFQSHLGYSAANCVFSASNVDYGTDWKPGGTLQITVEGLATRTIEQFSDQLGRFTSQTHVGKQGRKLTTISGYRVIEGCRGPASAYAQQRAMLVEAKRDPNPRKAFLDDLTSFIQHKQENGCNILLGLDANESTATFTVGYCEVSSYMRSS